jgi:hypothetical protein
MPTPAEDGAIVGIVEYGIRVNQIILSVLDYGQFEDHEFKAQAKQKLKSYWDDGKAVGIKEEDLRRVRDEAEALVVGEFFQAITKDREAAEGRRKVALQILASAEEAYGMTGDPELAELKEALLAE